VGEVLQRIGPQSQQQKLRPCEVCGSLLSVNGTHFNFTSFSHFIECSSNITITQSYQTSLKRRKITRYLLVVIVIVIVIIIIM
jgi:hypothetical protein